MQRTSLFIFTLLAVFLVISHPLRADLVDKSESGDQYSRYLLFRKCKDCLGEQLDIDSVIKLVRRMENDIEKMREQAETSDPIIQNKIGFMYEVKGQRYFKEAIRWYKFAADQGLARAQNNLAMMYSYGYGVDINHSIAIKLLQKSAEQGLDIAQFNLAAYFTAGENAPVDYVEALKLCKAAIAQGNDYAMNNFAYMLENGLGVEQSSSEAARYYRMAAEKGNIYAQVGLGNALINGVGVQKDIFEAIKLYTKAALNGFSIAERLLGECYYSGLGVTADLPKAIELWMKAATAGDSLAQFHIGGVFERGDGLEKDINKAISWYRKSAEQGDVGASFRLGNIFYNGDGVDRDIAEATKWYKISADRGEVRGIQIIKAEIEKNDKLIEARLRAAEFAKQSSASWRILKTKDELLNKTDLVAVYLLKIEDGEVEVRLSRGNEKDRIRYNLTFYDLKLPIKIQSYITIGGRGSETRFVKGRVALNESVYEMVFDMSRDFNNVITGLISFDANVGLFTSNEFYSQENQAKRINGGGVVESGENSNLVYRLIFEIPTNKGLVTIKIPPSCAAVSALLAQ